MEAFKTYLSENIYNLISVLTGILGVGLAIYFYFKSKKVKRPTYTITSFPLLNSEIKKVDNLEVKYLGKTVNNLTATKFAFWNAGRDTINRIDFPENSPLKIESRKDILIYSVEIIYSSDESNKIEYSFPESKVNLIEEFMTSNQKEITLTFDYLDYNQGAIFKILHSGNSSEDLIISGIVKGVGKIRLASFNIFSSVYTYIATLGLYVSSVFLLSSLININKLSVNSNITLSFFIVFLLFFIYYYWKYRLNQIPKTLAKKFNE